MLKAPILIFGILLTLLASACSPTLEVRKQVDQVWSFENDGLSIALTWDFPVLGNLTPTIVLGTVETLE